MIIELRFDQLRPRRVPAYEAQLKAALRERTLLSPLGGCWRTEVGNIDQVVQLWTYPDTATRESVAAQAAALSGWRGVEASEHVLEQEVRLVTPAPFSPAIAPRAFGKIYELRIYDYDAGAIPNIVERWQEKIEARVKLSPLVMCGYSAGGRLNQWFHLWAYENALERQRIRAESLKQQIWPPDATAGLVRQRSMLLVPSDFSLLS
jgi:hypothetical protein